MKHNAAGAHLLTHLFFEPAELPDDRANYCLYCSFLPHCKHWVLIFTLEWSGAHPMDQMAQESFELGPFNPESYALPAAPHWLGIHNKKAGNVMGEYQPSV